MTHCAGYSAAAVAERSVVSSLGVDAEPDAPLPDGVLETIAHPEEISMLRRLPHTDGHSWDRLLFSAKESVYKAWYPLTGLWLGFEDVFVSIGATGTFEARFLVDGPLIDGVRVEQLLGRWAPGRGLLVTAIALAAPSEVEGQALLAVPAPPSRLGVRPP
jgi:4'-phosphopantetheinyl transferase EntD